MTDARTTIVAAAYDALGERYTEWAARVRDDPRGRFLDELASRLEPGARVLDLGCGSGTPSTAWLARSFDVVGVELSEVQLERARREIPSATFVAADMCEVEFPDGTFDAVTALYSVTHVPRERHAEFFARIARWLRPGAWLLASLGALGGDDWIGDWLGEQTFFSSWDADANRRLLREAGFQLVVDEVVTMREPEGPATFFWALARNRC